MYNFTINNLPINFHNYFVKGNAIHNYATRFSGDYRPTAFNYDLAMNTIRSQGPLLWNDIPDDIKSALSPKVFKRKYKMHLVSQYHD